MSLSDSFIRTTLKQIDSPDVIGVGIVGSYARRQENKYSDVDFDIFVSELPENPYDCYTLRYWDEKLISLKYTLLADERAALTDPRRAIWAVPGLHGMKILLDKGGAAALTLYRLSAALFAALIPEKQREVVNKTLQLIKETGI